MAVKKMQYQNLDHSLRLFRGQVSEGLEYAKQEMPPLDTPEKVFNWLKLRTRYKHDPKNTELFQTLPTLLDNNFHGITGAGDCDCFTIAALSTLIANGFTDCGIVLVGRNRFQPVHIYAYVNDNGKRYHLDLTNKYFDQTRFYPYAQYIPYIINQNEKNMMLQLADNEGLSRKRPSFKRPNPNSRAVQIHKQRQQEFWRKQQEGRRLRRNPDHIFIPSQGVQIREDYFDNLSAGEFQHMLLDEGYELEEIVELSGKRGDRRRAKKADKQQQKKEKRAAKTDKIKAKAEAKRARAEAKKMKAQAKIDKANRSGSGGDDGEEEGGWQGKVGKYFGKAVGGVSKVMKAYRGQDNEDVEDVDAEEVESNVGSGTGNRARVGKSSEPTNAPKTVTIMGKEISQTTAIVGGVGLALLIGGVAYAATRPKKRAA